MLTSGPHMLHGACSPPHHMLSYIHEHAHTQIFKNKTTTKNIEPSVLVILVCHSGLLLVQQVSLSLWGHIRYIAYHKPTLQFVAVAKL